MTSELTGVEGVQLGILLYHFFHSHLGKTKYEYIRNSVSDSATACHVSSRAHKKQDWSRQGTLRISILPRD
jgi:hypothetical protein